MHGGIQQWRTQEAWRLNLLLILHQKDAWFKCPKSRSFSVPGIDTNEYSLGVHCTQCGFHQRSREFSLPLCLFSLLIHALIHLVQNDGGTTFSYVVIMNTDSICCLMKINVFHRLTWRCIPRHRIMRWFNKKIFSLWNGDQSITFCLIKVHDKN